MFFVFIFFELFVSYRIITKYFYNNIHNNSSLKYKTPQRFYLYFLLILSLLISTISLLTTNSTFHQIVILFLIYSLCCIFLFTVGFKKINSFLIKIIEYCINLNLLVFSLTSIAAIGLVFYSIFMNSYLFFNEIGIENFLFKTQWSPENYEFDLKNSFGVIPLVINTLYITLLSLVVSFVFGILPLKFHKM